MSENRAPNRGRVGRQAGGGPSKSAGAHGDQRQWSAGKIAELAQSFNDGKALQLEFDECLGEAEEAFGAGEGAQAVAKAPKLGALLAVVAQNCCKAISGEQSSSKASFGNDSCRGEDLPHATVALRALRMLLAIRDEVTFKHPLAPESLVQKLVGVCAEAKCFETAVEASNLLFKSFADLDYVTFPDDADSPLCYKPLRPSQNIDEEDDLWVKACGIITFSVYNCVRSLVEQGLSRESLKASRANLGFWLQELGKHDANKSVAFAKAQFSLFYHHGAAAQEAKRNFEMTFSLRVEALQNLRMCFSTPRDCAKASDIVITEKLITACHRYAKSSPTPDSKTNTAVALEILDVFDSFEGFTAELISTEDPSISNIQFYRKLCFQLNDVERALDMYARWLEHVPDPCCVRAEIIITLLMAMIEWTLTTKQKAPSQCIKHLLESLHSEDVAASSAFPDLCAALTTCVRPCAAEDATALTFKHFLHRLEKELVNLTQTCAKTKNAQLQSVLVSFLKVAAGVSPQGLLKPRIACHRLLMDRESGSSNGMDNAIKHLGAMCEIAELDESLYRTLANAAYNVGARLFNAGDYSDAVPFLQKSTEYADEAAVSQVSLAERYNVLAVCQQRAGLLHESRKSFACMIADQISKDEVPDVTGFCKCTEELVSNQGEEIICVSTLLDTTVYGESADAWMRLLIRLQLDAYMSLGCLNLGNALLEHVQERCKDISQSAMIDIEHARSLIIRSIGMDVGASEEERKERLIEATELCDRAMQDVQDDQSASTSINFWLGTCEQALEGQGERICAAVDQWSMQGSGEFDYCSLQDIGFAGEWCEVIGLHEASFRARAIFIRAARAADPERLVQIAAHKESKLGVALLARLLYEQSDRLGETLAAVVAAKFYKLEFLNQHQQQDHANQCQEDEPPSLADDIESLDERAEVNSARSTHSGGLGEFVCTLETRVTDVMNTLDPEAQSDEYATCAFLLASLSFASTTDSAVVLNTALNALKLRAACQETPAGPLAVTGVNWKHVNDVVDCLELLCEVYVSRGDPRTARYYVERGHALAERVGSDALMNRFQMLKGRIALMCGKPDDAEALLGSLKKEQSGKVGLQLLMCRASVALARHDIDAAAEVVGEAEDAWRAFVDQLETSQHAEDQDEVAIATLGGLDIDETELAARAKASLSKRAARQKHRSRCSVFAEEAKIQILGLQARLALLRGKDPTKWLTQAAEIGEGNPTLEREVCRSNIALGQAYLAKNKWSQGLTVLQDALYSAQRVDASPETGRALFRGLSVAMTKTRASNAVASADWQVAALMHASFGLALSLERTRLWTDKPCHVLHSPWDNVIDAGAHLKQICSKDLPDDMAVCSVTALDELELLCVSRLTRSRNPLTLILPLQQHEEDLAKKMRALVEAAEQTTRGTTADSTAGWDRTRKRQWWDDRQRLDKELQDLLSNVETAWLGPAAVTLLAPTASALGIDTKEVDAEAAAAFKGLGLKKSDVTSAEMEIFNVLTLAVSAGMHNAVSDTLEHAVEVLLSKPLGLKTRDHLNLVECVRQAGNRLTGSYDNELLDEEEVVDASSRSSSGCSSQDELVKSSSQQRVKLNKNPNEMKVVELRAALAERNLRTSGLKKELIARLEAYEEEMDAMESDGESDSGCESGQQEGLPKEQVGSKTTVASNEIVKVQGSLILVLDEMLQGIPFEAMPCIHTRCVSRMPSFAFIAERLSSIGRKISLRGAEYMIDPRGDLNSTAKAMQPFLDSVTKGLGWKGTCGRLKTPSEGSALLKRALSEAPVFLYCGHGSGEELLSREQLAQLNACATTLLMGCSSGKLRSQGIFEPAGVVLAYMLAGSLAVVANLWDVTDKDIDRFTLSMLEAWMGKKRSLPEAVQDARAACKLPFLVGAAPICIGMPVSSTTAKTIK